MSKEFTSGPWRWKGDELWGEHPVEGIGTVQKMIGIFRGVAHPSVIAANKRLIEAAPDLLAALEALEPYLSTEAQMLDSASLNEGRASTFDVASMAARKAVAKATREP